MRPQISMADPAYFEVRYAINPWSGRRIGRTSIVTPRSAPGTS